MDNKIKPEISIIMPVYNAELFISEAINSILSQSFTNFEFILIDDSSTDRSVEIIKSFIDDRIRFFKSEKKGIMYQLNLGIQQSESPFIARMDADDISELTRLEKQYIFLINNCDIDLVGTNYINIDSNGKKTGVKNYPELNDDIMFMMPVESGVCHPSVLFRKSVFTDTEMYRQEFESAEDHELFLRLINSGKRFHNIQEPLYRYRLYDQNNTEEKIKKQNTLSYKIGTMYLTNNYSPNYSSIEKYNFEFRMGVIEYYRGSISRARIHFIKALLVSKGKLFKILRYLVVTLLGHRIINLLREKKYLVKFSRNINNLTGFDLKKLRS